MSEQQLSALIAKLKVDAELRARLKEAADFDAIVAIAKDAGFDVVKADLLANQSGQSVELSDEELEGVAAGAGTDECSNDDWYQCACCVETAILSRW